MATPHLAPSLAVLRTEINQRWPNRDKESDGWIGDAAHQAQGSASDHNPNARGSVDALDVDEDGVDFPTIFAAIKRHPSARYVIYERKLYHRLRGWKPEPYSGPNPHDKHFHLSIDQTREAEQDTRPWGLLEDDMDAKQANELHQVFTGLFNGGSSMGRRVDPDGAGPAAASNSVVAKLDYLLAHVDALEKRPPVVIDYDQLADAIVQRVISGGKPA